MEQDYNLQTKHSLYCYLMDTNNVLNINQNFEVVVCDDPSHRKQVS